jgi:hypothetical protein
MNEQDEEKIRAIVRDEISALFHEVETMTGQNEPQNLKGDTKTPRGLLRLLFIHARQRYYEVMDKLK